MSSMNPLSLRRGRGLGRGSPSVPEPRIGFIGAGQLASVLAPALAQAGYTVTAVTSAQQADAEALAKRVPGAQAVPTPQAVAEANDLVFLTVPDDAIAAVAGGIRWRPQSA